MQNKFIEIGCRLCNMLITKKIQLPWHKQIPIMTTTITYLSHRIFATDNSICFRKVTFFHTICFIWTNYSLDVYIKEWSKYWKRAINNEFQPYLQRNKLKTTCIQFAKSCFPFWMETWDEWRASNFCQNIQAFRFSFLSTQQQMQRNQQMKRIPTN